MIEITITSLQNLPIHHVPVGEIQIKLNMYHYELFYIEGGAGLEPANPTKLFGMF